MNAKRFLLKVESVEGRVLFGGLEDVDFEAYPEKVGQEDAFCGYFLALESIGTAHAVFLVMDIVLDKFSGGRIDHRDIERGSDELGDYRLPYKLKYIFLARSLFSIAIGTALVNAVNYYFNGCELSEDLKVRDKMIENGNFKNYGYALGGTVGGFLVDWVLLYENLELGHGFQFVLGGGLSMSFYTFSYCLNYGCFDTGDKGNQSTVSIA